MLCNKSLAEISKQAETLGLPKVGPYWLYLDGDFIARLLDVGCVANTSLCRRTIRARELPFAGSTDAPHMVVLFDLSARQSRGGGALRMNALAQRGLVPVGH